MAQITWRNIDAPRFAESAAMYESAGRQLADAFKGISGAAQELQATQVRDNTNRYLMGALQAQDADQLSAFMQGEGAGILAAAGANIDPSALLQSQGLLDSLIGRKTNQLNQGVLEQDIGSQGALNELLMAASMGQEVPPEVQAQALMNSGYASAAPSINMGNRQLAQNNYQFDRRMDLSERELASNNAYRNASLNLNRQKAMLGTGNGKLPTEIANALSAAALSNPNNPAGYLAEVDDIMAAYPELTSQILDEAVGAKKVAGAILEGTGLGKNLSKNTPLGEISVGGVSALENLIGKDTAKQYDPKHIAAISQQLKNAFDNLGADKGKYVKVNREAIVGLLDKANTDTSLFDAAANTLQDTVTGLVSILGGSAFGSPSGLKEGMNHRIANELLNSGALINTEQTNEFGIGIPLPALNNKNLFYFNR